MRRLLALIIFLIPSVLFAQEIGEVEFYGKVEDVGSGKKMAGVTIEILKNGKPYQTRATTSSGKYSVKGTMRDKYTIKFKKDGYVMKFVEIDLTTIPEEEASRDLPLEVNMTLFKDHEKVDFSVLNRKPIGKLAYDARSGAPDWDWDYTKSITKEVDKLLDEKAELEEEEREREEEQQEAFEDFVKDGDKAMRSEEYAEAVTNYEAALNIMPEDPDVQIKLDEAKELAKEKAEQEKIDKQYNALMTKAESAFDAENYEDAKKSYKEASELKPSESEPKDKITEIDKILADMAEMLEKYNEFMEKGDNAMSAEKWDEAIAAYEGALDVKENDSKATKKLEEAEKKKEEAEKAAEAEAEKREKYEELVADADSELGDEKFEEAKDLYNQALGLYPDEQYPKDKIEEIDKKLDEIAEREAEMKAKEEKYENLMAEAKSLFDSESYEDAKAKYTEASQVFPEREPPHQKIEEINELLKELAEKEAAEAAKREKYDALIEQADSKYDAENWEQARSNYEEASKVLPDEQYPKDRIEAIDNKLEEIAEAEAEAAAKQKKYDDLIAEADGLFSDESWEDAKSKYEEASEIFPDEQHPRKRIEEINKKLEEIAKAEAEAEAERKKQEKYDKLIADADEMFDIEEYESAKEKYKEAFEVIPEDYPQQRIDEINEILKELTQKQEVAKQIEKIMGVADKKFDEEDYTGAKELYQRVQKLNPDNERAAEQIEKIDEIVAEQKAKQDKYDQTIAAADNAFNGEKWEDAKEKYNEALEIFPDEQYPKDQLDAIEKKLEEIAKQEAAEQEEAEKQARYDELIAEGDQAMSSSSYSDAREAYKAALNYFDKQYPKDQLAKIDELLAEQEKQQKYDELVALADEQFASENYDAAKESYKDAFEVMPKDYPQKKIDEINDILKQQTQEQEVEKQYQKIIDVADEKLSNGQFSDAKGLYERASKLKPSDPYPKEKMKEIDRMLAEMAAKESNYTNLIKKADGQFDAEKYKDALASYKEAKALFDRQHPNDRIKEIEAILNKQMAQEEKESKYNELIAKADQQFESENYETAKETYKEAHGVIPKQYPQDQVDKINEILQRLNRKENAEKQYQKIIDAADKEFANKDYESSRELYKRAISLKPEDPYPPEQIKKIDEALRALAEAEKNEAKQAEYDRIIAEADRQFNSESYKDAKETYKKAYKVLPKQYPQDQIDKINELLQAEAESEREKMYQKIIAQADKDFDAENYKSAKGYYKRANSLRPEDGYPKKRLREIAAILNADKGEIDEEGLGELVSDQSVLDGMRLLREGEQDQYARQVDSVSDRGDYYLEKTKERTDKNAEWRFDQQERFDEYAEEIKAEHLKNDEMRQDNVEDLRDREERHNETVAEMGEESEDVRFENRERVLETEEYIAELNFERNERRIENAEDLEEQEDKHLETVAEMGEDHDENRFDNRETIVESEEMMAEANRERDGNREDNIEDLREKQEDHNEAVSEMGEDHDENRFDNRETIVESEEMMAEANRERDGNREDNVEELRDKQEDHNEAVSEMGEDHDESRFDNREIIVESEEMMAEANRERDDNRVENSEVLKEASEKHREATSGLADEQKERAYDNKAVMDEMLYTEPEEFTPAVKDALARKYKQGVTTLTYNTKNEHGDVTRVTIRKIVVDGNVGNDYRMVMTRHGRTYFKNGRPIAEHQWKMETSPRVD